MVYAATAHKLPGVFERVVAWHLDGNNYVHPSPDVEDATRGENVQIGACAVLEDVTVEDSVIFPEATIRSGIVRRSLVDETTTIESLNLSGAVIGSRTRLNGC